MTMDEDTRDVELSTITAIYPELQVDANDPHRVSIDIPISLLKPLTVLFPAVAVEVPSLASSANAEVDSQTLSHLPALQVNIALPDGYPQKEPPLVCVSTSPAWLPNDILTSLEASATALWEDLGRDQVIFTYLDDLQRASDDVFGLVNSQGALEVALDHKLALLDYDMNAKRKAFEKETFECGICLDPKKGTACHKMIDCGHVFCIQCLQDFYKNAITEGDVDAVTCLAPNCAREREKDATQASSHKGRKLKTSISPSELLQIPLHQDTVQRYVMLKHKTKLESDKNTVYCPRSWCQGAARSKRHRKPEGLELVDSDDEEEEDTGLLAICEDCGFAFCTRCGQSWHGELNYCMPKERKEAITEEEKASLEYLKLHSTPCPTCAAPCQKSHGCNHMRCFRCQTHFCYLCSAWLDASNPYKHFNSVQSACYMRLWELEGGDGNDVGIDYEGGDAMRNANLAAGQYGDHLELVQQPRAEQPRAVQQDREPRPGREEVQEAPAPQEPPQEAPQEPLPQRRIAIAREGPLVLRIEGGVPPVQNREEPPRRAAAANPPAANPRANAGRGGGRRGRAGAGANARQARVPARGAARPDNGARIRHPQPAALPHGPPDLNPHHQAWVRHFVQLALNDEEHLVDEDSDDE
ncbi:RWD-domain-containing protein [Nemania sp. FL0916]|nr:RWD-domain-containing protein [Nemania sp. FL0916]